MFRLIGFSVIFLGYIAFSAMVQPEANRQAAVQRCFTTELKGSIDPGRLGAASRKCFQNL